MNDLNNRSDTLTQPDYRARVVDGRLGKLLKAFGAVEIVGPKWWKDMDGAFPLAKYGSSG